MTMRARRASAARLARQRRNRGASWMHATSGRAARITRLTAPASSRSDRTLYVSKRSTTTPCILSSGGYGGESGRDRGQAQHLVRTGEGRGGNEHRAHSPLGPQPVPAKELFRR